MQQFTDVRWLLNSSLFHPISERAKNMQARASAKVLRARRPENHVGIVLIQQALQAAEREDARRVSLLLEHPAVRKADLRFAWPLWEQLSVYSLRFRIPSIFDLATTMMRKGADEGEADRPLEACQQRAKLLSFKRRKEALDHAIALQRAVDFDNRVRRAEALVRAGLGDEAGTLLDQLAKERPEDGRVRVRQALISLDELSIEKIAKAEKLLGPVVPADADRLWYETATYISLSRALPQVLNLA